MIDITHKRCKKFREFWATRREHIQVNSSEIRSVTYADFLAVDFYIENLNFTGERKKLQEQFFRSLDFSPFPESKIDTLSSKNSQ